MSVIKEGVVSGVLPDTEGFAVHYPAYPSSISRAVETLGGIDEIFKKRSWHPKMEPPKMELRFRPEDPYSHPAFGKLRPCSGLLLRISKKKSSSSSSDVQNPQQSGASGNNCGTIEDVSDVAATREEESTLSMQLCAEVVTRVHEAYHFEGMVDYQHVLAVHAAESRRKKRNWSEVEQYFERGGLMDIEQEDLMMLVPPLFSLKDQSEDIVLTPTTNLKSKQQQEAVVQQYWEMDIEPCMKIDFDIKKIPGKVNWEDNIPKDSPEWEWQMAVSKLFDERPIWPRWSLDERLRDDGLEISGNHLKRLLFRSGYYFSRGPFGQFLIRKGYDPRNDPESRIYQKVDFRMPPSLRNFVEDNTNDKSNHTWKDLCRFQVFPSKSFTYMQLFELDDDYIQQEIRKPSQQKSCTLSTGWFSSLTLYILRLRVRIRFLSIYPKQGAENLLKSDCKHFERYKKLQVLNEIPGAVEEEDPYINREFIGQSSDPQPLRNDEDVPNECEVEGEEEEEEGDWDEYEHVAGEAGSSSPAESSYPLGENISGNCMQELLRGFNLMKGDKDHQPNDKDQGAADSSDGEYQIYGQDSDDSDSYFDEDGFP